MVTGMKVTGYHRPTTLAEALELLARPGARVIGGGITVAATPGAEPVEVIDLQAVGLDRIEWHHDRLAVGATVTLQQVADDPAVPPVVREAARREAPSTLRTLATVGGCVAGGSWDSELLAALLAHDATVELTGTGGTGHLPLSGLLADPARRAGAVITTVTVDPTGRAAAARTGRTPADRPIVVAVARRTPDGTRRLALAGVAATPVLVDGPGALDRLDPPGDERGSGPYRRALAAVLAARAEEAIG